MTDKKHAEILEAARSRMAICVDADSTDRADAVDDLRFLLGGKNQWDVEAVKQRQLDGRPCMTFNKLPAFLRQITNDQRQNTPAIKVHPVDSGADVKVAEVIQGIIRHIEYASNADTAYDTAVNSAASCGRGFFRLLTEYESEDSFNQVIKFKRERNPLNVYIDPYSQEPDGSDMRYAIITDLMPRDEFKRQYPKANILNSDALLGLGASANHWLQDDGVIVAEYYWIDQKPATLVMLSSGETGYKDDLDAASMEAAGITITQERASTKPVVRWAKITGADVLAETEIPCKWIPVFPVYGEELDVEGKVYRKGVIRDSKDPAKMYNYWMTTATEEVALRPKVPFIGAEGQFEVDKSKWANANNKSFPFIQYKPVSLNGTLAPPPQRQAMADVPVGVLQMAMHATEDVKATTGIHDASLGAGGNETSGRAILARQREGDVSNFHFTDNLNKSVRHAGRCIIDMIPHIYDTARVVRLRGEDEKLAYAQINQIERVQDENGNPIEQVLNDLSIGKYDVTVSAGPSYTTQRQEAAEGMVQLAQGYPALMQIAGDKVISNMDWPGADEIAERIARTIPPEIKGEEDGDQPQQLPPEVQQQLQQMDAVIQQQQQQLQEVNNGLTKAQIDAESRIEVARINAQSRQDAEELKGLIALLVQRMVPPPELAQAAYQTGLPRQEAPPLPPQPEQPQSPQTAGFDVSGSQEFAPEPIDTQGLDIAPQGVEQLPGAELPGQQEIVQ